MITSSALVTTLLGLLYSGSAEGVVVHRQVETMGTVLWIEVEAEDRLSGLEASEEVMRQVEAAEARLSTWTQESELSQLLTSEAGKRVELTPLLAEELAAARRVAGLTRGAFEPSVGVLSRAWGLRTGGRTPSELEIERARGQCGADLWELDGRFAVRRSAAVVLDEGGFGKGAALDQALKALASKSVTGATLNLGGQLAFLGTAEQSVPVADPLNRGVTLIELKVRGGSVATSANTERAGHILDPRTGHPAADFGSVTVWAQDALSADALSTGLFVLGPDAGLELVEHIKGVEAVFIEATRPERRIRVSEGLRNRVRLLSPGVASLSISDPGGRAIATD